MKTFPLLAGPTVLATLTLTAALILTAAPASAQVIRLDLSAEGRGQTIDGFGTCLSGTEAQQDWWRQLYFDDLRASMVRMDLVPHFKAPYSDFTYNSPWFHNDPALPGPEGNNVRTYTSAADYTRSFGGRSAAIAVMGPDIDQNVGYFDFEDDGPKTAGLLAQLGAERRTELGDFKLIGSMWSPPPWLKVTSGGIIDGQSDILPVNGTPWPFIWGGNFAGGRLDTSDEPRAEFDDSSLGGSGPTSAVTQMARALAAYLRGFQRAYGVRLHAISIQNELNFETFYNSCTYPLSKQYLTALKAARAELDRYEDLAAIRIMGPEDLLGGDAYGMWQYGSGETVTHKNLQYLASIAADPEAAAAVDFFCIHGYAPDGVGSAGATPLSWQWWADGWTESPAGGLPAPVTGFAGYGKKSWMTETSGEQTDWLAPAGAFPGAGAFSVALKLHQALTTGRQSAWVYWQMSDGSPGGDQTLTDATLREASPKYVAAKHFFRYVRPGAVATRAAVEGAEGLLASGYVHETDGTVTLVLINTSEAPIEATFEVPAEAPAGITSFEVHTSADGALWQPSEGAVTDGAVTAQVPAYGVVTLFGQGQGTTPLPDGGPGDGGPLDGGPGADGTGPATDGGADAERPADGLTGGPDGRATDGDGGRSESAGGGCNCQMAAATPEAAAGGLVLLLLALLAATRLHWRGRGP